MAAQDCIANSGGSKAQRRLKVGYISTRHEDRKTGLTLHYSQYPSLHLKGNWLKEAGFETGTPLKVRVMPGCLVLTAQELPPPPPPEPEIMRTLRKVCKLSARKQRQVTELIEVISKPQR